MYYSEIPQERVLGPYLFRILLHDFTKIKQKNKNKKENKLTHTALYADDTKLYTGPRTVSSPFLKDYTENGKFNF